MENLKGLRVGRLQVEKLDRCGKQGSYWVCRCSCGTTKVIRGFYLKHHRTLSCGCLQKERTAASRWKGYANINGRFWYDIKQQASRRQLPFTITITDAWLQFEKQDGKCMLSGVEITLTRNSKHQTASLDRIDSKKGYEIGNIQWVHKDVNQMKSNRTQESFIDWCHKITSHQNNNCSTL